VPKQAAIKTIAVLNERGYVISEPHPDDGHLKRLRVSPLGHKLLRQGEAVFDKLRRQWEQQSGASELTWLETHLETLAGKPSVRFDSASWIASNTGETGSGRNSALPISGQITNS
jgi:hypothetical protein